MAGLNGAPPMGIRITARARLTSNRHVGRVRRLCLRDAVGGSEQFAISPRVLPKLERDWKRIDVKQSPPCGLITRSMKLAVMDPTKRDGELVADSTPECTRLRKGEVMRI